MSKKIKKSCLKFVLFEINVYLCTVNLRRGVSALKILTVNY